MRNRALFQGRFQPVNIGHTSTLSVILQQWTYVTVGIVYNSIRPTNVDPRLNEYLEKTETQSYGPGRNPFNPVEVKEMWGAYLDYEHLKERVDCVVIKRMEYEEDFDILFPSAVVDLVWPELSERNGEVDALRHKLYPEVFNRPIFNVQPVMRIHNKNIRELVQSGMARWEQFIPPGAYEVFMSIGGPQRIKEASRLQDTT